MTFQFQSPDKPDCKDCNRILEELENIDDDTDRHGIHFVKTMDLRIAREYGIRTFPSLVYFEYSQPSVYEGRARFFLLVDPWDYSEAFEEEGGEHFQISERRKRNE